MSQVREGFTPDEKTNSCRRGSRHALYRRVCRFGGSEVMTCNNAVVQRLRMFGFLFVAALAVSTPTVFGQTYSPPANPREDINLDAGWRFIRQDVPAATNVVFDDSSWTAISLPHTWNNLDGQDGGNNYYRGIGWYRRHYTVSTNEAGRRLFLKFDGVNIVSVVYVNGNRLGDHGGGGGVGGGGWC